MNKLKIFNRIIILITIFGLSTFSSCIIVNEPEPETKTIVEIVVKDSSGNRSNWTVYQMSDTKFNLYGADTFFRDQQSVTDSNGLATFEIDKIDFAAGGQKTYYFFVKYSIGGVSKSKNVGITLSKGDKKTETLLMN